MAEGPGSGPWETWAFEQLDDARTSGRLRTTRSFDALGPVGRLDGSEVISFASNDYLGLSAHPRVIEAARDAAQRWGAGSTASRLVVGTRPAHDQLESLLASWKETESALVFSSGYAANLGCSADSAVPVRSS
ncbi:MAG: aminotransferase class I/II-fold pyridoxal phosphate-dependent enzyme [Microthrixaceae bacterium]